VIGLAALLVADRAALWITQAVAEHRISREADATGVDVHLHGFPFLTQLARRDLDDVTLAADSANLGGVHVSDVHVTAHGVALRDPYRVDHGTVDALVSLASLDPLVQARTHVPVQLTATDDGLRASLSVLGLDVALVLAPHVEGNEVTVDVVSASIGGARVDVSSLPSVVRGWLSDFAVPLDLPSGVTLTGVDVVPDDGGAGALRLTAVGKDVPLADLASS
jgi:hypothetical protein